MKDLNQAITRQDLEESIAILKQTIDTQQAEINSLKESNAQLVQTNEILQQTIKTKLEPIERDSKKQSLDFQAELASILLKKEQDMHEQLSRVTKAIAAAESELQRANQLHAKSLELTAKAEQYMANNPVGLALAKNGLFGSEPQQSGKNPEQENLDWLASFQISQLSQ